MSELASIPDRPTVPQEKYVDDEDICNRLGSRLGGVPGLLVAMFMPLFVAFITAYGLAFYFQNHAVSPLLKMSLINWVCGIGLAIFLVAPLVYLKLRRALVFLGIILALFVVAQGIIALATQ